MAIAKSRTPKYQEQEAGYEQATRDRYTFLVVLGVVPWALPRSRNWSRIYEGIGTASRTCQLDRSWSCGPASPVARSAWAAGAAAATSGARSTRPPLGMIVVIVIFRGQHAGSRAESSAFGCRRADRLRLHDPADGRGQQCLMMNFDAASSRAGSADAFCA